MDEEIKKVYDGIHKKYLPHGDIDMQAGAKETHHIFNNLTASNAQSIFLKTLFKFTFSGVPDDHEFQEKLSASGLVHTTKEQRERFRTYLTFIIAGTAFARSPKDIYFHNGKYTVHKEAPTQKNYSIRSFVVGALIALFGSSVFGITSAPSISNPQVQTPLSAQGQSSGRLDFSALEQSENPPVKKSRTGICHPEGGTFYEKTKNFVSYDSIDDCLASGGRMPRR